MQSKPKKNPVGRPEVEERAHSYTVSLKPSVKAKILKNTKKKSLTEVLKTHL